MIFKRILAVATVALLGAVGAAVPATPAAAAGKFVGVDGNSGRCVKSTGGYRAVCFYWYAYQEGAYWGGSSAGSGQVSNLGTVYFFSGTGAGSGYPVRNNAASIECTIATYDQCYSYYNTNFSGNFDYLWWGQVGQLFYTWNDNASVKWI